MTILANMNLSVYKWIFGICGAVMLGLMVYLIVKLCRQLYFDKKSIISPKISVII